VSRELSPELNAATIAELLDDEPVTYGVQIVAVELAAGEAAWNPASTSRCLYGPALVIYTRYPDGGVEAKVFDR